MVMNPLLETGINGIWIAYRDQMAAVEEKLHAILTGIVPLASEMTSYVVSGGGKRLRPLLMVISSRLSGAEGPEPILLAAVVEMIHTATLLHDDVVDNADVRRGKKAAHQRWGNQPAILVGDFLYANSLWLAMGLHSHEVNDSLTLACKKMSEGEILELFLDGNLDATEDQYYNVAACKTATLTASTCRLGGILGGLSDEEKEALDRFGYYVGMAFQVADDALDYMASEEKLGKTLGRDLSEGKMTLPLIHCLATSSADSRSRLVTKVGSGEIRNGDLDEVLRLMKDTGSIEYSLGRAREFTRKAQESLECFSHSLPKQHLLALSDFVISREM
ncbi:MAG: polyprenyl synthetase family protein [Nitrospiraceae bacterium]|jgi:octaprenyl-diphosphate synthase|nr:polyprenyl synthetase family protein [Nitrospiraceae bacterium]